MASRKPYAEACERNAPPILEVLQRFLPASGELLEIGSGTGQHAVQFARALPFIRWQTSDLQAMHEGIMLWLAEANLPNLTPPLALDVFDQDNWPDRQFDAVYTANTLHIVSEAGVELMFAGVAKLLKPEGLFFTYGPFMYDGKHTSERNWSFDLTNRAWDENRGIRDVSWLKSVAATSGLALAGDIEMPSNNRTLIWRHAGSRSTDH